MALTDARADGQGHHGLKVARGRAIQSEGLKRDRLLEMQMRIPLMKLTTYRRGSSRSGYVLPSPCLVTGLLRVLASPQSGYASTGPPSLGPPLPWRRDSGRRRHGAAVHASVWGGAWEGRRSAAVAMTAVVRVERCGVKGRRGRGSL